MTTEKVETVIYRTYSFPGTLFDEESSTEVKSRDVKAAAKDAPKGAFAFRFHERTKMVVGGETLWGPERLVSPTYYLGGKTYTAGDVEEHFPREKILLSNMKGNGYDRVIQTRRGNWKDFKKTDVIVKVPA